MRNISISGKRYVELDGLTCELSSSVEKARCIMRDVTEGYLGQAKIESADDIAMLRLGYNEASMKAEVVEDYLFDIKSLIGKIENLLNSCEEKVSTIG